MPAGGSSILRRCTAAEAVTGDLLAAMGVRARAFLATKVWTTGRESGIAQMQRSRAAIAHRSR
jgi:aryl-alcohol dehydrogenase-like predicted oxidoreductase